ncbi:roadblock/LC7 domain-containing protein [Deinococcus petrolearius]|uniref:Roadblock/LC7 domain-containing protein n=1 Tax=Deinococcus petrolearius TaxID=1751295 RepID=A0ABW1DNJ1_9DEIO
MTATLSKQDRLNATLTNLRTSMPELRGALVATVDGLPIAQAMSDGTDANRVAAMAATALGLGKRINDTLGSGSLTDMSVSGAQGQVYIYAAGNKGVLAVVTPSGMNLGLLHMEARDTAENVANIL